MKKTCNMIASTLLALVLLFANISPALALTIQTLPKPANVNISVISGRYTAQWSAVSHASGYELKVYKNSAIVKAYQLTTTRYDISSLLAYKGYGSYKITVSAKGSAYYAPSGAAVSPAVNYPYVAPTSVRLNLLSLQLPVGGKYTLSATVYPSNTTNKSVKWASDNTSVATVANGVVTAKTGGVATITVTTVDGNKRYHCTVTVKVPVASVKLNKTATTIIAGSSERLTATVYPTNATNKAVKWASDNTAVATVANGVVTGKAEGTAMITVTTIDGNKRYHCTVTVKVPVSSVSLNKDQTTITVGSSETLTATVYPGNATNKSVTWSSDNAAAASVVDGVVYANAAGNATITVTTVDGSKTDTCYVTTIDPNYTVDDGQYHLINSSTGRYLNGYDSTSIHYQWQVVSCPSDGTPEQIFTFQKQSDGTYIISIDKYGRVLTIDGSISSGTRLISSVNTNSSNQRFVLTRKSGDCYTISPASNQSLAIEESSTAAYAPLNYYFTDLVPLTGDATQYWLFTKIPDANTARMNDGAVIHFSHIDASVSAYYQSRCIISATTAMFRRWQAKNGASNDNLISESQVFWDNYKGQDPDILMMWSTGDWTGTGATTATATRPSSTQDRINTVVNLLQQHPEGIVCFFCPAGSYDHAVLIVDYRDGVFYALDYWYNNINTPSISERLGNSGAFNTEDTNTLFSRLNHIYYITN